MSPVHFVGQKPEPAVSSATRLWKSFALRRYINAVPDMKQTNVSYKKWYLNHTSSCAKRKNVTRGISCFFKTPLDNSFTYDLIKVLQTDNLFCSFFFTDVSSSSSSFY